MIPGVPQPRGEVVIVAHRGSSGEAPENTRAAFELAAASGAETVEFDVRLCLSGEAVVIHDRNVDRTTNGRGPVRNLPLSKLQSLDAGSWFHRRFRGERILTLDEALELLRSFRWINIELKSDAARSPDAALLVERTIASVQNAHLGEKVILSSFHHNLLHTVHALAPRIATMAIYSALLHRSRMPATIVRKTGSVGFVGGKHEILLPMLRNARRNNIPVFVFTLNTEQELRKWIRRGIAGVITNYPRRAVEERKRIKE